MPKVHDPSQPYAGRRLDAVVLNLTLDQEAVSILHRYAVPGRKTIGRFVARLLYEHEARQQARAECLADHPKEGQS